MKLPGSYPRLLRTLAEHGYVAKSGNSVRIVLGTQQNRKHAVVALWRQRPSENDKKEFEQLVSAEANVERGPALEEPEAAASAMVRFLKS